MGFSRQEYWSGLPFPPPGDLPNPGIKPTSPALAGGFFTAEPPGLPYLKAGQRPEVEEHPERQGKKKIGVCRSGAMEPKERMCHKEAVASNTQNGWETQGSETWIYPLDWVSLVSLGLLQAISGGVKGWEINWSGLRSEWEVKKWRKGLTTGKSSKVWLWRFRDGNNWGRMLCQQWVYFSLF